MQARDAQDTRRECPNCGHRVRARAGNPPRFCRVCGHRLATVAQSPAIPQLQVGYAGSPAAETDGKAVASLLLGITGLFIPPLGLLAIVFGLAARATIAARPQERTGKGLAMAGIMLGAIETVLMLVVCGGVRIAI
ncbi:MAG: DUF4190 domain-containing protein [Phycisphaerae bacterium]|nr:DUF4190 domain-containing protein [Phycisphaerae bacterium]